MATAKKALAAKTVAKTTKPAANAVKAVAKPAVKAAPKAAAKPAAKAVKPAAKAAKPVAKKAAPAKTVKAPAKKVAAKKAVNTASAFYKALTPSAALAAVIGATPAARTEVVKKVWAYIKKNKLQDAVNKRNINADAKLKVIFKKDQVSMFELTKLISQNLSA